MKESQVSQAWFSIPITPVLPLLFSLSSQWRVAESLMKGWRMVVTGKRKDIVIHSNRECKHGGVEKGRRENWHRRTLSLCS
jgi:hypothetical protein